MQFSFPTSPEFGSLLMRSRPTPKLPFSSTLVIPYFVFLTVSLACYSTSTSAISPQMCVFFISICLHPLHRRSLSESSETGLSLTIALLQQLQIKQAFAETWNFTHHVLSHHTEKQLEKSQSLPFSTLARAGSSDDHLISCKTVDPTEICARL
jgi:hypothetical protein